MAKKKGKVHVRVGLSTEYMCRCDGLPDYVRVPDCYTIDPAITCHWCRLALQRNIDFAYPAAVDLAAQKAREAIREKARQSRMDSWDEAEDRRRNP